MITKAILLATAAHEHQLDLTGQPYIFHPLRVMEAVRVAGFDEHHQVVAVLHDTVEDTPMTLLNIRREFDEGVAAAVDALTRREVEKTYHSFILRARANGMARIVKRFDVLDNLGRIEGLEQVNAEKAQRLQKRYRNALRILEKA